MNYGSFSKSFSYTYYGNGLKQTFMTPDSTVYTYLYGLNNELQDVQIPGVGSITIPAYTWNRPQTVTFPGGTQRTYTYDALMRLQSLTATDPGGSSLLNYQYTHDEVGNILTKNTEHGTYTYGYDAVSRVISADNPVLDDESYTYDDVGNRLTSADVTGSWSYNTNNELFGYSDVEYDYDTNGNLTQITVAGSVVWTYTYDAANRLVHVEDGTGSITADYSYDPFGRRLWKDVGGTRTYFFYSEEGLIAEYDVSGTEIRSYGYRPDSLWTTDPLWQKIGSTYYWYQNDHLGTPQKLIDINGTMVWSAQYSAFGEAAIDVNTVENPLRFSGQYFDEETGLYYNWFRYYDPESGRYMRVDPIGFDGGDVNLYAYVWDNSVNWLDPWGLQVGLTPFHRAAIKFEAWVKHWGNFYNTIRNRRIWGQQQFPGEPGDSMRHCVVSCIIGSTYNTSAGFIAGAGNELQGLVWFDIRLVYCALTFWGTEEEDALGAGRLIGTVPWAFQLQDFTHNQLGFHCVSEGKCDPRNVEASCIKCCKSKIATHGPLTWEDIHITLFSSGMPIGLGP